MNALPMLADAAALVTSATQHHNPLTGVNTGLIGVMIGMLGLLLRYQLANRKLTIQVNGEVRKEFIEEMEALRSEIKTLRRENDLLRDEVRSLHGVIDGMRRETLTGQLSAQRVIADVLPQTPEIQRAMKSLGDIQGDRA